MPVEEKEIDGVYYHINRWADHNFIYKRIAIQQGQGASPQVHVEQVAKFGLTDFKHMLALYGSEVTAVFGNYNLDAYDATTSKRLVVVAKKNAKGNVFCK